MRLLLPSWYSNFWYLKWIYSTIEFFSMMVLFHKTYFVHFDSLWEWPSSGLLMLSMSTKSRDSWGIIMPLDTCSIIWMRNTLRACLTSATYLFTICFKSGASSSKALSLGSSSQVRMKTPLSGWSWKFSATLSTIKVLLRSLPILARSYNIMHHYKWQLI